MSNKTCSFCGMPLTGGSTVCPGCGKSMVGTPQAHPWDDAPSTRGPGRSRWQMISMVVVAVAGLVALQVGRTDPFLLSCDSAKPNFEGGIGELTKLRLYEDHCIRGVTHMVRSDRTKYVAWAGREIVQATKVQRPGHMSGLLSFGDRCIQDIDKAAQLLPALPEVHAVASRLAGLIRLHAPLLQRAQLYYQSRSWLDDDWAEARLMHPELLRAWDELEAGTTALREAIEPRSYAALLHLAEGTDKEPGNLADAMQDMIMLPALLAHLAEKDELSTVDGANFTKTLERFERSLSRADKALATGGGGKSYNTSARVAREFAGMMVPPAREFARALRTAEGGSPGNARPSDSGATGGVFWTYDMNLARYWDEYVNPPMDTTPPW